MSAAEAIVEVVAAIFSGIAEVSPKLGLFILGIIICVCIAIFFMGRSHSQALADAKLRMFTEGCTATTNYDANQNMKYWCANTKELLTIEQFLKQYPRVEK